MRKWEAALSRDTEAWADFLSWIDGLRMKALEQMTVVSAEQHEHQRGIVHGIEAVRYQATANHREEDERARRVAGPSTPGCG